MSHSIDHAPAIGNTNAVTLYVHVFMTRIFVVGSAGEAASFIFGLLVFCSARLDIVVWACYLIHKGWLRLFCCVGFKLLLPGYAMVFLLIAITLIKILCFTTTR